MDRCPKCSCPTIDGQQRCVACAGAVGLVAARVDGRRMAPGGVAISMAEVALFVVLAVLVATLSLAVLT